MKAGRPTVVDLFAGAGLFSLAFKQSGFHILRAIEKDRVAAQTYAQNLGQHIEVADVAFARPQGRCDVLIAGPPCQGFSTLGRRLSTDPRNQLSLQVVRWSRVLRPRIIVIENVAAFLESVHWREVVKHLHREGYHVDAYLLDAFDYGCPQFRRRSFTLANRAGGSLLAPKRRRRIQSVREAWDGLSSRPNGKNHHYSPRPSEMALARMRLIPPGGDKRDIMLRAPNLAAPSWWTTSCEVTDAWGRMEWHEPSNTLRTALQNPSKGRYIHPEQQRVISLREAARLQSIPDDWSFAGLPTQIARQIGNSVPPALGRSIARLVFDAL